MVYSKTCLKRPLKKEHQNWFSRPISFNAAQKYCRMKHSVILLPSLSYHLSLRPLVCLFFEWPFKSGFTVLIIEDIVKTKESCYEQIFIMICHMFGKFTALFVMKMKPNKIGGQQWLSRRVLSLKSRGHWFLSLTGGMVLCP